MNRLQIENIGLDPGLILQMGQGFWVSKTLFAATELEIFTRLAAKGPMTVAEFARELDIEQRPAEMLLVACTALGLLVKRGDEFKNSPLADMWLDKNKPTYIGDVLLMMDRRLYRSWGELVRALRTNKPISYDPEEGGLFDHLMSNTDEMKFFTRAMHAISVGPAIALAQGFDFSPFKCLIDIGGGSGVYSIQAALKFPHLRAVVFDLGPACEVAEEYIRASGLQGRVTTKVGNFFTDQLPYEGDLALLSHIIHDWSREEDVRLLGRIYDRLPSGGGVIISEWLLDDDKTGPIPAALMSLNMLVETPAGRNYSFREIADMLKEVGFSEMAARPLAGPVSIVTARKP